MAAWSRDGGGVGRSSQNPRACVEALAAGQSVGLGEAEAKSDSKGSGWSNEGTGMNSGGEDGGRRGDVELSFGPTRERRLSDTPMGELSAQRNVQCRARFPGKPSASLGPRLSSVTWG